MADESVLKDSTEKILKKHRVEELIRYEYEKETERKTKYVGRGRGSANRKKEVVERIRYQIIEVRQNEEKIREVRERFGWKIHVTDVSKEKLSFKDAILCYRQEHRAERIFNRLKSRLNIAPLFVRKDDQIIGMTHLLMLGVRVLTLTEYVVRRSLQRDRSGLERLHPENRKKNADRPTAERILKAFSDITLTITRIGDKIIRHLTPLSEVQKEILNRAGLSCDLYQNLEINQSVF